MMVFIVGTMAQIGNKTMTSAINNAIPTAGTLVDATEIRNNFATAKTEISALQTDKLAKDGSVIPTANLPMNGFKHTGVAPAAAAGQYIEYNQAYAMVSLGKNCLINGNFNINQRAVSGTVTLAAGIYGHDRWKAGASGCTYTFAVSAGVTTLTITAGSLLQIIEGSNLPLGTNTCALSWSGTAQGKIGAGSYAATGTTASVAAGTNLSIEFNTGTLSLVQLEKGAVVTPFEQRMISYELALCLFYYEQITAVTALEAVAAGIVFSTTSAYLMMPYARKRSSPTISISLNFGAVCDGTVKTMTAYQTLNAGLSSCQVVATGTFTNLNSAILLRASAIGDKITISAEL